MNRRLTTAVVALGLVGGCFVQALPASAQGGDGGRCLGQKQLQVGARHSAYGWAKGCAPRNGIVQTPVGTMTIPQLGHGVGVERINSDGSTTGLRLSHPSRGVLVVRGLGGGGRHASPELVADTGCTDNAYATDGHYFGHSWSWRFNGGGVANVKALRKALNRGLADITQRHTDCGATSPLPSNVQPTYRGKTSRAPNTSADGACGPPDGKSVVGFGPLTQGSWGYTCWWWADASRVTTEADMLLKNNLDWWTASRLGGCSNRPDLEGLTAHEFGHAFGLLHVDESTHPDQTMSTYINSYCSGLERTLGAGDLAGLASLYGP